MQAEQHTRDHSNDAGFFEKAKQAFKANWLQTTLNDASEIEKLWNDCVALSTKAGGRRLPFDNVDDPGLVLEYHALERELLKEHLPGPAADEAKGPISSNASLAREELREAAWRAAGQHGFAALAGLPELQQVIAYTCLPLAEAASRTVPLLNMYDGPNNEMAAHAKKVVSQQDVNLLHHVPPQLRVCLLAEVAAGLLCPGLAPPPDTPEHGAALYEFLCMGREKLEKEVADAAQPPFSTHQQETLPAVRDASGALVKQHVDLQLQVSGQHLLDMLCQVIEGPSSSSSSSGGGSRGGSGQAREASAAAAAAIGRHTSTAAAPTAAMPTAAPFSSQQCDALQMLMWQWHPVLQLCQALQQMGSDDAAQYVYRQSLTAVQRLMHEVHGTACPKPNSGPVDAEQLPWQLLNAAKDLEPSAASLHSELDVGDLSVMGQIISEQMQLLVGGLVLQFVQRARAQAGIAWQQEVPLQVLVLLAALEQLQGLLLTAVQQGDVARASAAAAAHMRKQREGQGAAAEALAEAAPAEATAAAQQPQRGQQIHSNLQKIPIVVDESGSEHSGSESDREHGCDSEMELLEQQEQQAAHHQQSQGDPTSAAEQPNKQLMHTLMKVLEIIQLLRQFEELNEAVNAAATGDNSAAGAAEAAAAAAGAPGSGAAASWEALCSPNGSLHAWYPEPCTLGAWGGPTADGSCSTATTAAWQSAESPSSSKGSIAQQQQQQQGGMKPTVGNPVQQLCADAFRGALLLFQAQEAAHQTLGSILQDPRQHYGAVRGTIKQLVTLEGFEELLRQLQQCAEMTGLECSEGVLLEIYALGSAVMEAAREQYSKALEGQAGVDASWTTVYDAGEASLSERGSSSSSASKAGRQYGAYDRHRQPPSQQQNGVAAAGGGGGGDTVQVIKQSGQSMRSCVELLEQQIEQPVQGWLKGWWRNREKQLQAAYTWWNDPECRTAWLASRSDDLNEQRSSSSTQGAGAGSMFNRITQGITTSISSGIAWATSAKHGDAAVSAEPSQPEKAPAASSTSGSNSSSKGRVRPPGQYNRCEGCPLCTEELAAGAGSSSDGNAYGSWPVAWEDAFFWRRLMWQLLGRLKPSAQQLYAQKFALCPHGGSESLWRSVWCSIAYCLWLPPDGNPVSRQLCYPDVRGKNARRARLVAQYARALTSAYCQSYDSPAAALLSQQVLLALSPLHQAVVPAPETAALCPSSFGPAVNQLLARKLGVGRLLLREWHDNNPNATLRMWHVWFHIGIRRYYWMKQRRRDAEPILLAVSELQQQASSSGTDPQEPERVSKSSKKQKARQQQQQQQQQCPLYQLPDAKLQQLYLDPDARYYAAGFAARQVAPFEGAWGCPTQQESSKPHIRSSHMLAEYVLHIRMQVLGQHVRPAEGGGLQSSNREQMLQRMYAVCTEMMMLQRKREAGHVDVLPPTFLPAGWLGLESDEAWLLNHEMRNKAGEASRLTSWPRLYIGGLHSWLQGHEAFSRLCDVCHKPSVERKGMVSTYQPFFSCTCCGSGLYCSAECRDSDAEQHAFLCGHLVEVHKRYAGSSSSSSGQSLHSRGDNSRRPGYHWRVLTLLQPEGGVLGSSCGALD